MPMWQSSDEQFSLRQSALGRFTFVQIGSSNDAQCSATRIKINRAFRDRGMNPARDQRGCSTPFGNPSDFVPAASC
ncbi:MAG: hypothetical protein ACXWWP_12730, partial [Candidatus Binatia bacterium]